MVESFSNGRTMVEPSPFALAERVAEAAHALGIQIALIGASALAAHNYVRATDDVDFASAVDPYTKLRALEHALQALGIRAELRTPDAEDPLGGLLQVWEREEAYLDDDGDEQVRRVDVVEVINFYNPHDPRRTPAADAIRNAVRLDDGTLLKYVQIADLVALKLYAGGRRDLADIAELLVKNPRADVSEIRRVAAPFDRTHQLEDLIAEAAIRRQRPSR